MNWKEYLREHSCTAIDAIRTAKNSGEADDSQARETLTTGTFPSVTCCMREAGFI